MFSNLPDHEEDVDLFTAFVLIPLLAVFLGVILMKERLDGAWRRIVRPTRR